ncbi:ribonuclease P protein component [candidate division KSB1 bacterium]
MNTNILRKDFVIKRRDRINEILKEGQRFRGTFTSLYYLPSQRMAFAVLIRKDVGKPFQRNKVKRWIREIYRIEFPQLARQFEVIVLAHCRYHSITYRSLRDDMLALFQKLKDTLL